MAAIKQPLQDIMARLVSLQTVEGAPLFQYVRKFNDQFKLLKEGGNIEAIPLPAALVKMVEPISWNQMGGGLKQADITWEIHIGMEQLDAGDGTMEQNLDIFDQFRDLVEAGLTGFVAIASTPLFCIGESPDYEHTNLYFYILSFKCGYIDSKGSPYDQAAGKFIYKQPPTDLQVDNAVSQDPVADRIAPEFKGEFIINP